MPFANTNLVPTYDPAALQWPGFANGRVPLAPVRVGIDRRTGKMLVGKQHVDQSMNLIFTTRFHTRVLRRWVGSFVPHLLGNNATPRFITRFFWSIAGAIDLWEPDFRLDKIDISATTEHDLQILGRLVEQSTGVYRLRAHLGDTTPTVRRGAGIRGSQPLGEQ